MALNYRQFRQVGREQWIVQPDPFRKIFIRLVGPLGVHARIRNSRVINAILRLKLPQNAEILDAGCGHAYTTFWLARNRPQYQITALELDAQLIQNGRQIVQKLGLNQIEFVEGSVSDLSDIGRFDLIFSIDVLEHVVDDLGVLTAFRKALKPDGYLILHLPRRHQEHRRFLQGFKHHTTPDHVRDEYTATEITEKLKQTNFTVEYLRYGFSMWGELAFELNNLLWKYKLLRIATAFILHPIATWLAYMDTRHDYEDGNSLLILAKPAG